MSTKEDIQTSINSRLTTSPTKIEGGTTQDIIGSVSYELANIIDTQVDVILDNAFVTTADEEHLIIKGEELGLYRKEATYATVNAIITDADANAEITTEVRAQTDDGVIFWVNEETTADEDGYAVVNMTCIESGSIGNIGKGELNQFYTTYSGLSNASITNDEYGEGGYEEEDIEDYRQRILEYLQTDACNSNIANYKTWAESVSGVKNVVVKDAFTAGAGNVWVYISATDNAEVTDSLIEAVTEYIEQEQIVNASVSVFPLEYLEINISATLSLDDGISLSDVVSEFEENLQEYLDTIPSSVSYLYISNLFFGIDGVNDVSDYLLNESTQSVTVDTLQIPIIGEITLTKE